MWKTIGILIGFRKWDIEAWSSVSGLRYIDTKCKEKESERERVSSNRLEREGGWDIEVIERSEREGFW